MQSEIRNPKSEILIVGAGPAGTSAAIRLAQKGFAVTLLEREKFPRQKLCGEFISPECLAHFRALGVFEEMLAAGGDRIRETVFYAPNGRSVGVPSKWFNGAGYALGLSRAEMDFRLLERAKAVGVRVLEETSATGLLIENRKVCGVQTRGKDGLTREISADLTIDATGRAGVLGKLAEREFSTQRRRGQWTMDNGQWRTYGIQNAKSKVQNRLVGFKTHLKNVQIKKGVCEIYFFRGGYGGLTWVEGGAANHCFLIRAGVVKEFGGDAEKIVREVVFKNERAREAMRDAVPIYEWLAVTVDGFGRKNLSPAPNLLAIGDAGAFIDPFTGSGMLMALESGEVLCEAVTSNLAAPEIIAEHYETLHRRKFGSRLRVCAVLRRAAFAPHFAELIISALNFSEKSRQILARATRTALPAPEE